MDNSSTFKTVHHCPSPPDHYHDRHTYAIAVHVTPSDNSRYLAQAHQGVIESYHAERDYLLAQIDQLETMVGVLKHENRTLVQQIGQLDPESIQKSQRKSRSPSPPPAKRPRLVDNNNNDSNESSTMAPVMVVPETVLKAVPKTVQKLDPKAIPKRLKRPIPKLTILPPICPWPEVSFRAPIAPPPPLLKNRNRMQPLLSVPLYPLPLPPPFLPPMPPLPPPPEFYFPFLFARHQSPFF